MRSLLLSLRKDTETEEYVKVNSWQEVGHYSVDGISIAGSLVQSQESERQLMVVDLIGREVNNNTTKATLLYIYDDVVLIKGAI